ncbi:MAG: anti-sigma factor [Alphaproteobacteria bacterium]|nr:anti-sigma factor [Alphaproteobacteria bacterium]
MIPENPEELQALAGEYVLGVLDKEEAGEVAAELATNAELRRAVALWEERLYPLSSIAAPAEPPSGTWQAIEARISASVAKPTSQSPWNNLAVWRWSTAAFAAAAAGLALWIAVTPVPGPSLVAVLHPPQQGQGSWIATAGRSGLALRAVTTATPPGDRTFELWVITPGTTRPRPLGVIPRDGELTLTPLPPDLRDGATLAISIEPAGGSPTQQPTGPVVFVGSMNAV